MQGVVDVVVAHTAIDLELQPVVAIAAAQTLADACLLGGHLADVAVTQQVDIAHVVAIAGISRRVHVEIARGVNGRIEREVTTNIPVAVDILRMRLASARNWVILHHVGHRITRGGEVQIGKDEALMTLIVVVEAPVEPLGERRLQGGITAGDVQRVTVVGDGQQVTHRRLAGRSTILEAHLTAVTEFPTEVCRRTPVHHIALGDGVESQMTVSEL